MGGGKAAADSAPVEAQSGLEPNIIRHTIEFWLSSKQLYEKAIIL
jgi:hypothetical protein